MTDGSVTESFGLPLFTDAGLKFSPKTSSADDQNVIDQIVLEEVFNPIFKDLKPDVKKTYIDLSEKIINSRSPQEKKKYIKKMESNLVKGGGWKDLRHLLQDVVEARRVLTAASREVGPQVEVNVDKDGKVFVAGVNILRALPETKAARRLADRFCQAWNTLSQEQQREALNFGKSRSLQDQTIKKIQNQRLILSAIGQRTVRYQQGDGVTSTLRMQEPGVGVTSYQPGIPTELERPSQHPTWGPEKERQELNHWVGQMAELNDERNKDYKDIFDTLAKVGRSRGAMLSFSGKPTAKDRETMRQPQGTFTLEVEEEGVQHTEILGVPDYNVPGDPWGTTPSTSKESGLATSGRRLEDVAGCDRLSLTGRLSTVDRMVHQLQFQMKELFEGGIRDPYLEKAFLLLQEKGVNLGALSQGEQQQLNKYLEEVEKGMPRGFAWARDDSGNIEWVQKEAGVQKEGKGRFFPVVELRAIDHSLLSGGSGSPDVNDEIYAPIASMWTSGSVLGKIGAILFGVLRLSLLEFIFVRPIWYAVSSRSQKGPSLWQPVRVNWLQGDLWSRFWSVVTVLGRVALVGWLVESFWQTLTQEGRWSAQESFATEALSKLSEKQLQGGHPLELMGVPAKVSLVFTGLSVNAVSPQWGEELPKEKLQQAYAKQKALHEKYREEQALQGLEELWNTYQAFPDSVEAFEALEAALEVHLRPRSSFWSRRSEPQLAKLNKKGIETLEKAFTKERERAVVQKAALLDALWELAYGKEEEPQEVRIVARDMLAKELGFRLILHCKSGKDRTGLAAALVLASWHDRREPPGGDAAQIKKEIKDSILSKAFQGYTRAALLQATHYAEVMTDKAAVQVSGDFSKRVTGGYPDIQMLDPDWQLSEEEQDQAGQGDGGEGSPNERTPLL